MEQTRLKQINTTVENTTKEAQNKHIPLRRTVRVYVVGTAERVAVIVMVFRPGDKEMSSDSAPLATDKAPSLMSTVFSPPEVTVGVIATANSSLSTTIEYVSWPVEKEGERERISFEVVSTFKFEREACVPSVACSRSTASNK